MSAWDKIRKFFSMRTAERITKKNVKVALERLEVDPSDIITGIVMQAVMILVNPKLAMADLKEAFGDKLEAYSEFMELLAHIKAALKSIQSKL